jgi:hypothetical protein
VGNFDESIQAIDLALETMAREVIRAHLDPSRVENERFLAHPDDRRQHQMEWHQWGILTHTREFLRHYEVTIPALLAEWSMDRRVAEILSTLIDGVPRGELLKVSILLHDIGKFAARTESRTGFHFARHERLSGTIVRDELSLERFGLTRSQIDYVAMTAEDHFVLGLARKWARDRHLYDEHFPYTEQFHALALDISADHPNDAAEIGILFLGDSLAKVDPHNGPPRAVSQYGINIDVAREYLRVVLGPSL